MGKPVSSKNEKDLVIGYSGFKLFEESYEYNEDSCYIANSPKSLREFMDGSFLGGGEYRIEAVKLNHLREDFGCSCGNYALESQAFRRFEKLAKINGVSYEVQSEEDSIFVVKLD